VWLVVSLIPLLKFAGGVSLSSRLEGFVTYAYVVGIPGTILSALVFLRVKNAFLTASLVVVMVGIQWYIIANDDLTFKYDDDRRALATATFLIENRPDLLEQGKLAILPGDIAREIGQYARGQNWVLSMIVNFPRYIEEISRERSVGEPAVDIIITYALKGELKADWLILYPELLQPSKENQSFEFYRRLYADPQISWVACFRDQYERKLWLGEVKPDGVPIDMAMVYEVEPLAEVYNKKYNRINFLKRNVNYILHY
jgi:hypothetical protein